MSAPILVTGATGKVGGAMVKRLLAAGAHVRAAAHYPDREAADRHDPVDWIEIDFNRRDSLAPAFSGVEKAVLITPEDVAMVCQTAELLDAARAAGVSKVVRVSFMNAGDDGAGGPLLAWHREAERMVEESGIPYTILRPNSYMQNFVTTYAPSIHLKHAFFTPMGKGRISYVDALDVGDVAVEVLLGDGHEGKTYSLTGPDSLLARRDRGHPEPRGGPADPLRRRGRGRRLQRVAPTRRARRSSPPCCASCGSTCVATSSRRWPTGWRRSSVARRRRSRSSRMSTRLSSASRR